MTTLSVESGSTDSSAKSVRLLSIDALRGFDMLLIAGGGTFLELMEGKTGWSWVDFLAKQMYHAGWNEHIKFYDLIFPIFLFLAGASLTFSLNKELALGRKKNDLYLKAFWRMLIFIGIDIVYKNPGISFFEPSNIRYLGILGRIGITGFFTTLIYLNCQKYSRLIWIAAILLLYYAALFLIPVPGFGAGDLSSMESNVVGWAFLFMALFYWLIDVKKYQRWAFFFKVIGMNSLATYLLYYFINFYYTSNLLFYGFYAPAPEQWHLVFEAIGALALVWLTLYFMYRKKIFLKV